MNIQYYNDGSLKITKEYISFENIIMPTSALSFVYYGRKDVSWWKPILMIAAGLILIFLDYFEIDILKWVSWGLIGYGVYELIQAFIESRKMEFYFYSHSGKDISFEIDRGQEILDAVHNMLDNVVGDDSKETTTNDIDITEEGTFEVILNSCDVTKKITVVKCIYDLLKIDLKEAKEIVDNAPKTVKKCISERAAEKIKKVLEAAGAEIEIRNDQ